MRNKHTIPYFLKWFEGTLTDSERAKIEDHLSHCDTCRSYYDKMEDILSNPDRTSLNELEPDPYLPVRIDAMVKAKDASRISDRRINWIQWSWSAFALLIALFIGIFLGKGLFQPESENAGLTIASEYYEAFNQETLADKWEYIFIQEGEEIR